MRIFEYAEILGKESTVHPERVVRVRNREVDLLDLYLEDVTGISAVDVDRARRECDRPALCW